MSRNSWKTEEGLFQELLYVTKCILVLGKNKRLGMACGWEWLYVTKEGRGWL